MEERVAAKEEAEVESSFLKYTFFKLARDWRLLGDDERRSAREELASFLARNEAAMGLQLFSLVGIRGDTDFLVLAESRDLESFQDLVSGILSTKVGRYLDIPYSYLAMTRRSRYLGSHRHPGQEGSSTEGGAVRQSRYLFVYPFIKKRSWYGLPFPERQRIMGEHFKVGHKYPMVKIHTGYSFGIDDQEFVLAFEADDPRDFLALVEELRSSEASKYTELETPIFTCRRTDSARLLELIS
ncbi:MAG TPA: chlorite dismutase family protein [Nitrososphaerales archaeon]|nr:chlorite dismutase family protein [Nitrososphaerales archaeon]